MERMFIRRFPFWHAVMPMFLFFSLLLALPYMLRWWWFGMLFAAGLVAVSTLVYAVTAKKKRRYAEIVGKVSGLKPSIDSLKTAEYWLSCRDGNGISVGTKLSNGGYVVQVMKRSCIVATVTDGGTK